MRDIAEEIANWMETPETMGTTYDAIIREIRKRWGAPSSTDSPGRQSTDPAPAAPTASTGEASGSCVSSVDGDTNRDTKTISTDET